MNLKAKIVINSVFKTRFLWSRLNNFTISILINGFLFWLFFSFIDVEIVLTIESIICSMLIDWVSKRDNKESINFYLDLILKVLNPQLISVSCIINALKLYLNAFYNHFTGRSLIGSIFTDSFWLVKALKLMWIYINQSHSVMMAVICFEFTK